MKAVYDPAPSLQKLLQESRGGKSPRISIVRIENGLQERKNFTKESLEETNYI